MGSSDGQRSDRGRWMALTAALLGWLFDGLEMGLFPQAGRPALRDLLGVSDERVISLWFSVATAGFLVGAATGGVLFGWLGDRIGRVRAMTLSVLTYALFSGLCAAVTSAGQIAACRFLSALGMGGEWSLGVALVMELWSDRSRALLAALIGAAANVGYLLIGLIVLRVGEGLAEIERGMAAAGLPEKLVAALVSHHGWRLLMLVGALPALLTFFIRLFVPESGRWKHEQERGATSYWATRDLLAVALGTLAGITMIYLWAAELSLPVRAAGSAVALVLITLGYLYPVMRYLQRAGAVGGVAASPWLPTVRRMLLGACLGGVPLLVTWSSIQWASFWADQLTGGNMPGPKAYAGMVGALGAIVASVAAPLVGDWLGRRVTYSILCVTSLAAVLALFQLNDHFGTGFLVCLFFAGGLSASFYGWLPLYLPELFATRVRATGQGFSFNFGRILAAVGVLQTGNLVGLLGGSYPKACSIMSLIYLVGLGVIWLAPETRGQPLPE